MFCSKLPDFRIISNREEKRQRRNTTEEERGEKKVQAFLFKTALFLRVRLYDLVSFPFASREAGV